MGNRTIEISYEKNRPNQPENIATKQTKVKKRDTVVFTTKKTRATVWVPNANKLFGEPEPLMFDIDPGNPSKTFTVANWRGKQKGENFPFAAYCTSGNNFAEGDSSPEVIIEEDDD